MKASIITIGDEILIGQTIDTNSAWIGSELSKSGFDVIKITSVHDRRTDILDALNEASRTSNVVLVTGGLGPTSDDITKQTLCEFFGSKLITNKDVLTLIESMMKLRNFPMNENNRKQAEVPESCKVLENRTGTAPGMWFEKDATVFVSMPGVPHEMKYIMNEHVLPELRRKFTSQVIIHRNIMTFGTFEARLAEMLESFEAEIPANIKLAYLPASGVIKLRLTGTGSSHEALEKQVDEQVKKLYRIIPDFIYGENEESLSMVTGRLLKEKKMTVCTAESCTGGEIAHMITSISGSSVWYKGTVVSYANEAKTNILGIPGEVIERHGAVSSEVVSGMARSARKLFRTDFAIATSGIAGPDGGTAEKPVGTVWIAVDSAKGTISEKHVFGSDRNSNITRFSLVALNFLRKQLL